VRWVIFHQGLGVITRVIDAPALSMAQLQLQPGEGLLEGDADDRANYVLDNAIVPRPEMPVEVSGNTLSVPAGTEFSVRGPAFMSGIATDGVLEFEFSEPGRYTIHLANWPYRDAEVLLEN